MREGVGKESGMEMKARERGRGGKEKKGKEGSVFNGVFLCLVCLF